LGRKRKRKDNAETQSSLRFAERTKAKQRDYTVDAEDAEVHREENPRAQTGVSVPQDGKARTGLKTGHYRGIRT
jgi:hypothetical protein